MMHFLYFTHESLQSSYYEMTSLRIDFQNQTVYIHSNRGIIKIEVHKIIKTAHAVYMVRSE